jgi:protein Tex
MEKTYPAAIAQELNVNKNQIQAVIKLLDDGSTVPFIARYRKEATGELDEEQIRQTEKQLDRLRKLDARRGVILNSITQQGKMTSDLEKRIRESKIVTELEDLYQPYKQKRRTRAAIARENNLQTMANLILAQPVKREKPEDIALNYITEKVRSVEDVLSGARDIAAEAISEHVEIRQKTRQKAFKWGVIKSQKITSAADERQTYETYYEYENRVDRLRPHQTLAINRGEKDKVLRVSVDIAERDWHNVILEYFLPLSKSPYCEQLQMAIRDSAERLILPAIQRDVRRELTERAEVHAINVFASNLKSLLSQPPIADQVVMGIDPGFRTGCKVVVVDKTGRLLDTATIYPHNSPQKQTEALQELRRLVGNHQVTLVVIGNGTASRETERLIIELIREHQGLQYLIASEAGASVYSASPLARAELPQLDVSIRGAVSIARRVQDPLAELVKIDPKAIGVGMYQHDVNQTDMSQALHGVVESVVNKVGVDLNTASPALLAYVAGIGPKLADNIVSFRDKNGEYKNRNQIKAVKGLGGKAFEQSAGFLRIRKGENHLDESAIHPESYHIATQVLTEAGLVSNDSFEARTKAIQLLQIKVPVEQLAKQYGCGAPTMKDILDQLVQPGRDPRAELPKPILRTDLLTMEDLKLGLQVQGTVRNVVDFGAFVDIGVKQDGLLHRSQIPMGVSLQVGVILTVEILKVEIDRGRISLRYVTPE